MEREISVRLNLKSKKDGKPLSVHPPISSKMNGLMEFPVELNDWEILSIDRNSEIKIPDAIDREWEAFENDEITIMGANPKKYVIQFKNGMFGIIVDEETWIEDFVHTFESKVFINNQIREYHQQQFTLQKVLGKDINFFIPLSNLNIGGLIDMDETEEKTQAILLTKL